VLYQGGDLAKVPKTRRGRKAAKAYAEAASVAALPAAGEPRLDTDTLEKPIDKLNLETVNTAREQLEVEQRRLENLLKLAKDKNITRAELEVLMPKGQQRNLI
jgi:hypothetical protein